MIISTLFLPSVPRTPLIRGLIARCFFSPCRFWIDGWHLYIEVQSWESFLYLVWGAYAAVSRGSYPEVWGLRWGFRIVDKNIPVWVEYDSSVSAIRYGYDTVA